MKVKECRAFVKAAADTANDGIFESIVSVFGNEDSYGDVVQVGAFADDLAEWKASGNPLPVIWSHDWSDPFSHIGYALEAEELQPGDPRLPDDIKDNGGLYVKGQLDLDNPKAVQVYRLLKGRRVVQFSFAYDVIDGGYETTDGEEIYALRKLKIYEVGPTLVGANQETDLLAVKAAGLMAAVKEGRVLAAKHIETLQAAHDAIGAVITAATTSDDSKSSAAPAAESEEKTGQPPVTPNEDDAQRDATSSARPKRLSPAVLRASVTATALTEGIEL